MHASPDPRDVRLYQKALICQTFPAYKLSDLNDEPLIEIMQAIELLGVARQANS